MATRKKKSPKSRKPEFETIRTWELLSELAENPDTEPIPEHLKATIIQIVRAEVKAMLGGQAVQTVERELPPLPTEKVTNDKSGRRKAPGGRKKIAGTVDERLHQLFEKWRVNKGITLSRALDTALWHFLGKPPLSFETPQETGEDPDAWSVLHSIPEDAYED